MPQPGRCTWTTRGGRRRSGSDAKPRLGGARLAASYVNFYIANDRIVMPRLDERTDDAAIDVIAGSSRPRWWRSRA